MSICCKLLFSICLVLFSITPCFSATYFVDSRFGDDTNVGSQSSPWKTIGKVNNSQFLPGDSVLFAKGRTWNEMLVIPSSGTEGQLISFGPYGSGPLPLIDCTAPINNSWQQEAENIYSVASGQTYVLMYNDIPRHEVISVTLNPATESIPAPGAILLQDGPYNSLWVVGVDQDSKVLTGITNFKSWDTTRQIQVRQYNPDTGMEESWPWSFAPVDLTPKLVSLQDNGQWFWLEGKIYLYSDVHPDSLNIRVGRETFGIHTNQQDYLNIRSFKIVGANSTGALVGRTDHSIIQKLRIYGTGTLSFHTGLLVKDSSDNTISFNRINYTLGPGIAVFADNSVSKNNVITNNYIDMTGSAGILVGGDSPPKIEYNTVIANKVSNANQLTYDSAGIYFLYSGEGNAIKRNRIIDGGSAELKSAGIMLDNDAGPVLIERNTIRNNSHGGILVTEPGHTLRYNYLQNNGLPRFKTAEIVFFPVNENVADVDVHNNTIQTATDMPFFRVLNNSDAGHFINNNRYRGGSATPFSWQGQWKTFEQWQLDTGHDLDSRYNPAF